MAMQLKQMHACSRVVAKLCKSLLCNICHFLFKLRSVILEIQRFTKFGNVCHVISDTQKILQEY